MPEHFPSIADTVFPLYHVLADVGEFAGGSVVASQSSDLLKVDGLVLEGKGRQCILLSNYTSTPQHVTVQGLTGQRKLRWLDASTILFAMQEPDAFRAQLDSDLLSLEGSPMLTLPPHAILTLA